jgi:hypothetical protein
MSIKIISGHAIFNENAVVMSKKFNWDLEKDFDPQPNDLYIVFGAHEIAHFLLEIQYRKLNNFGYIILNSEQANSQFFKNKYYISLIKRNVVCDYNNISAQYLKDTFDIKVYSYFYFEFMKFENTNEDKEYDVCFVGSKSEKREALINKLIETNPNLNFYVDYDWKHVSAESITQILQKSRIVLNIPYYENNPLETHRIHKALACGCEVVSLPSADEDANNFYKDYIHFVDDLDTFPKLETKKNYEELVKQLSIKFNQHFSFVVDQVHKKLIK